MKLHFAAKVAATLALAAALLATGRVPLSTYAHAESAECGRLAQAIASAHGGGGEKFQAAAARQRGELDRTVAYAHQLGCENKKFLFLGSDPPAQCGEVISRISAMRGNLQSLESKAGGSDGGRAELQARYSAQCGQRNGGGGILDALFGGATEKAARQEPQPQPQIEIRPLSPDEPPRERVVGGQSQAMGGSKAVCVRSCNGAFFPVSYAAGGGRLDELGDMCHALCPNADVSLYTYPTSGEIEQAVSPTGARYMDSPTALKYRHSFDNSCSCRRRGQSWADALGGAEQKLGREYNSDIIVTQAKAAELSRPKIDPKGKIVRPGDIPRAPGVDVNGVDTSLSQQAATVSREGSGIGDSSLRGGSVVDQNRGKTEEMQSPDGTMRRVRIVDPAL